MPLSVQVDDLLVQSGKLIEEELFDMVAFVKLDMRGLFSTAMASPLQ